ncbi:MAG: hypothetical protein E6R03_10160 [Hyphomicrobiaceae bacterium]|nr:MAG: hypothetical protein E6R03_10160 [Hyphomicrobiaceae bacterium]
MIYFFNVFLVVLSLFVSPLLPSDGTNLGLSFIMLCVMSIVSQVYISAQKKTIKEFEGEISRLGRRIEGKNEVIESARGSMQRIIEFCEDHPRYGEVAGRAMVTVVNSMYEHVSDATNSSGAVADLRQRLSEYGEAVEKTLGTTPYKADSKLFDDDDEDEEEDD